MTQKSKPQARDWNRSSVDWAVSRKAGAFVMPGHEPSAADVPTCPTCGPEEELSGQYMSDESEDAGTYDGWLCGGCRGYWPGAVPPCASCGADGFAVDRGDHAPACPNARPADKVKRALVLLREARDLLADAQAPRTLARVRLAITSAGGALRHSSRADIEAARRHTSAS